MDYNCTYIPHEQTNAFSPLVLDYLALSNKLQQFYNYTPDADGIEKAIIDRKKVPINRVVLADTLSKQYDSTNTSEEVKQNIAALKNDNTFTICTAHQPNLLTGYLYFIYKIAHAIRLAKELNKKYSDKHFVPIYFMGSEDNDLDELGTFRYVDKQYRWQADGQTGAFGRMDTQSLKPLLDQLFTVLGPPSAHTDELKEILTTAYLQHKTIADATRYLVNELFGCYGLLVLDPDDSSFKNEIKDVIQDDLLNHTAQKLVSAQVAQLSTNYQSQAYPRGINLFYLQDNLRERIEIQGDKWVVVNTNIQWTKDELLNELEKHPERFSPNVILRGVLQERILPNIAFIGGGAEVAYWMQLNKTFEHYNTFFPVILLRQSAQLVSPQAAQLKSDLALDDTDMFKPVEQLKKEYVIQHTDNNWQTQTQKDQLTQLLNTLKVQASTIDPTLAASADAALAKIQHQLIVLEKKMLRAEKRKYDVEIKRIEKLHNLLYPAGGLQERKENFIQYYTLYGQDFVKTIVNNTLPLGNNFMIIYFS